MIDIDIKCFEYAWLPTDWREVGKTCVACVATWNETPVGMVIFGKTPDGDVEILKVGVKELYRRLGIGRRLIYNCALYAREIQALRLILVVPETRLCPGEEDDLSAWLTKLGFRAQVPLLRDYYTFYGKSEDGIVFSLPIPLA